MFQQQALFFGAKGKPVVHATNSDTGTTTSHTVAMPTHAAGDLIIVFFATPSNATHSIDIDNSDGTWTQVQNILIGTSLRFSSYSCIATTAAMLLVVGTSTSQNRKTISYTIRNADTVNYGTYVQVTALGTPNPPSLTLTNNPRNAIFIPIAFCTLTTYNPSAVSTNYTNKITSSGMVSCERSIDSATTEDPGAWTGNIGSSTGLVNTYAFYWL